MHRFKHLSTAAIVAFSVSALWAGIALANTMPQTYTVTIHKFVDGAPATASSTNSASFPMNSSWNDANSGPGSGTYSLGPTGVNSSKAYEAVTSALSKGSSYTTNEDTTGNMVGATCAAGKPFALAGYTTGTSPSAAASASASTTAPTFANITHNEYVDVWNTSCATATSTLAAPMNVSPSNGETLTSAQFNSASWTGVTDTQGGITYVYQASNASSTNADGSFTAPVYTSSPLSTTTISTSGTAEGTYFWHVQATDASGTMSSWSPTTWFTINNATSTSGGNSGGIGGTVSTPQGALAVTSIQPVQTNGSADNSYADGWKYIFNVTVPTDQTNVAMMFSDWLGTVASDTIPVGGNMRISSEQADNGDAPITLTAANTFSSPLHITGDLDPSTPGDQIQIEVDVKIPINTANDSYLTNYTVQSNP